MRKLYPDLYEKEMYPGPPDGKDDDPSQSA